ncbi:conserved domain protein [Yersinia pestis KIM D27]|nr:conserved domain protein [Yersinia pestis KIM D27]
MGKEYFFSVSYIEPNLVKRIREEKREEKSEGVLNQESGVAP